LNNSGVIQRDKNAVIKTGSWSTSELRELRELAEAGIGVEAIAAALERTSGAVRQQASRHRISLRKAGERRGSIMGELPHRRLEPELREAVFLGVTDPRSAERRSRAGGELCPGCAVRPSNTRSGLCDVCHLQRLIQGHRDELAVAGARLELDAARAMKYRQRKQHR
jgi:hypothetical protein